MPSKSDKKNIDEGLSRIDKFNLGLGIFNFIAVIASIFISIWGVNQSETIAKKSGAFDKGDLKFSFGGYFLLPNKTYDVYVGVNFADSSLHFGTLPFGIHNWGKKSVEDISLIIKYPNMANISVTDSLINQKNIFLDKFERKFQIDEPFDLVSYNLRSINPNFSVETPDLICFNKETKYSALIPVRTKDDYEINVQTNFSYTFDIFVGLTAKDIDTESFKFNLNLRNQINLETFINSIITEKLETKKKKEILPSFIVIIPKVSKTIGKEKEKITFLESSMSTTLLCQFDKDFKSVLILNQDGTLNKQIKLEEDK
jgi:hypothetical protein